MKRHNDQHISEIIGKIFNENSAIGEKQLNHKLQTQWPVVMGESVARLTASVVLRKKTVVLRLNSSVLRNEFKQNQGSLLKKINEILEIENFVDKVILL